MENSFVPHLKHISIIIIAIVVVFFSLSGVFSTRNIDNLAYIVALGLDVGQNDKLKLSIQLSKPKVRFRRLFRGSSRKYYRLGRMFFYKRWIRPF